MEALAIRGSCLREETALHCLDSLLIAIVKGVCLQMVDVPPGLGLPSRSQKHSTQDVYSTES